MLNVWCGVKGIIYWKLLPDGCTVTADLCCQQSDRIAQKLNGKQDRFYFLHDKARPHVAKSTREKLLELGYATIPHPPYSPSLARTDYHLFRSCSNVLREKKFDDESNLNTDLADIFSRKSLEFYELGMFSRPERWRQVVHSDEAYIIEKSSIFERKK